MDKPLQGNQAEEGCLERAKERGDATFSLVGQDLTSPAVICEWIKLNIETAPRGKLIHALERALFMRGQLGRRNAD